MSQHALLEAASGHFAKGELVEAEALYWEVLKADPKNLVACLNLASLLFDRGRIEESAKICRIVADQDADLPALNVLQSRIAFVTGNFARGLAHITRAHAAFPDESNIAAEFASAQRRHYWSVDSGQYPMLFEKASKGELGVPLLPRLVHQTLARLIRPRLLELLCGKPGEEKIAPDDVPLLDQWAAELEPAVREDLGVLRRNFEAALDVFHREPAFGPRAAVLRLRDGSVVTASDFSDLDPLTHGSVELVDPVDGVRFLSPVQISRIQFAPPAEATPVLVTPTDGADFQALMPIFGFFTTFSPDARVRGGSMTVARRLTASVSIPLGVRAWRADGKMIPMMNVESVEYIYD